LAQLDRDFNPKLGDFGLSQMLTTLKASSTNLSGTPTHMAPEQFIIGDKHNPLNADVYSFGMFLYELIANKVPFFFCFFIIFPVINISAVSFFWPKSVCNIATTTAWRATSNIGNFNSANSQCKNSNTVITMLSEISACLDGGKRARKLVGNHTQMLGARSLNSTLHGRSV
jgi:serine/threonine protein kinase